ncbi:MAG TPA: 3-dehydroquinate synthase [Gemmatimonadaceae bacterium]|nr:3-dehydroquinate synthase [Gemmatimonadaceae bacterium]
MVALPYPVVVRAGALDHIADTLRDVAPRLRVAIVTDSHVGPLYGERVAKTLGVEHATFVMPAGEQHKNRESWVRLTDDLLARGFGRDSLIIALGGGVVGDVAGFVAATYMRGIPVLQVPTTLLAMVDASIGGKTGVDTPAGKNLVGAFHPPVAVMIDPDVLRTLPADHMRAGFAEIVKHGVIADADYFEQASTFAERWPLGGARAGNAGLDELTDIIRRSVEIKASIVARDERESGLRRVLNFGHTIGHAIEAATDFATLHGQAVAIGLVAEARLAERIGVAANGTARVIERACRAAGLPTSLPSIPVDTIIGYTRMDKKARGGRVEYALPTRIGAMAGADSGWTVPVDDTVVKEALGAGGGGGGA